MIPSRRRPIVGVMGSGRRSWQERATPLGRWLAGRGCHLLTGGGSGVMAAVAAAYCTVPGRTGLSLGILPCEPDRPDRAPDGYPNSSIELPIRTHLPWSGERGTELGSRNHLNVLTSDVVVSLPGSAGTASEISLALRYRRPVVVWLGDEAEMPHCPAEAPRARDLDAVRRFVDRVLSQRS